MNWRYHVISCVVAIVVPCCQVRPKARSLVPFGLDPRTQECSSPLKLGLNPSIFHLPPKKVDWHSLQFQLHAPVSSPFWLMLFRTSNSHKWTSVFSRSSVLGGSIAGLCQKIRSKNRNAKKFGTDFLDRSMCFDKW